jgi:glycosyltransferase involved in cell wall biosynthesis
MAHDGDSGIEDRYISFFEIHDPASTNLDALGWGKWTTIWQMRRTVGKMFRSCPSGIAIYHNCWGLPLFENLDGSHRRLGYLHGIPPDMEATLKAQIGLLDGIIANSQPLAELAVHCLPELASGRISIVPLPISPPIREFPHSPLANRPIIIGYSGRLVKDIKRIDRLPKLVQCLSDSGAEFRLELLGDGRDGPWLRNQFRNDKRVIFHGARNGDAYWRILGGWDVQINTSDSEAISISLLEGLSCGVIPLFPGINSDGVSYTRRVDPSLVYSPADLAAAALTIIRIAQMPAAQLDSWRVKCREAVTTHTPASYQIAYRSFIEKIEALPRISRQTLENRPFYPTDHIPLGILSRLLPGGLLKK